MWNTVFKPTEKNNVKRSEVCQTDGFRRECQKHGSVQGQQVKENPKFTPNHLLFVNHCWCNNTFVYVFLILVFNTIKGVFVPFSVTLLIKLGWWSWWFLKRMSKTWNVQDHQLKENTQNHLLFVNHWWCNNTFVYLLFTTCF